MRRVHFYFQNLNTQTEKEPLLSLGGTIATQSHFLGTWVFVTNFTYDRYFSDYPEMSYILTLTHSLDPFWSIYLEHQGQKSDLFNDDLDVLLKENLKRDKALQYTSVGVHKDDLILQIENLAFCSKIKT